MASSIKAISDALISRIVSQVSSLSTRTVKSFPGFGYAEIINFPFCGVALGGEVHEELASDGSIAKEILTFRLTLAAEDFRSARYSLESTYALIEDVRDAIMGQRLGIDGLAPISILGIAPDSFMLTLGVTVYVMTIETWQVRQQV